MQSQLGSQCAAWHRRSTAPPAAAGRAALGQQQRWRARAAPPARQEAPSVAGKQLLYEAIALDMDGTLTKAHIDFVDMRKRTGIPIGDLFVVMESWEEPAADLGVRPGHMLMVGDSMEDVECGNAAGTASCLIAGGGNEVGTAPAAPPPGAVPTLTVDSLAELNSILLDTRPGGGAADGARREALLGWRARVPGGEDPTAVAAALMDPNEAGAPAPGLEFADWLIGMNALCIATTSFPRMGAAAGGLQACPVGGHTVLHLECGAGALTKMLASKGLMVCGADGDVGAAARRGLQCFSWGREGRGAAGALRPGALGDAQRRGPYDVALFYEPASPSGGLSLGALLAPSSLAEVRSVLKPGGRLCAEANGADAAAAAAALRAEGWRVDVAEVGPPGRVRVVAQAV
ncbi:hypothetical protein Rsub_01108 [Raphidocelis subcapitata]|uniref:Uncharacterized protein n=1 Tax=Raphidocelis subcapitata TaxID=307507 RepID=A0A2V0NLS9_9CHLO|nr:hypothetical protein Rsub_01108 [Raphidocelis subcapitata]|eukprot:GBF88396.1 hypothetical protein Rsub_01108 [Raphidocelis subcapitata]